MNEFGALVDCIRRPGPGPAACEGRLLHRRSAAADIVFQVDRLDLASGTDGAPQYERHPLTRASASHELQVRA